MQFETQLQFELGGAKAGAQLDGAMAHGPRVDGPWSIASVNS